MAELVLYGIRLLAQASLGKLSTNESGPRCAGKKIRLEIIEASTAFNNVTGGSRDLDLLHVNCEGCEYEMLENIIKAGLHWRIKIIQFGTHFFQEIPRLTERFCAIRSELKKSHRMVYGLAFGWERWDRK